MTSFLLHPKTFFLGSVLFLVGLIGVSAFFEEAKKRGRDPKDSGYLGQFRIFAATAVVGGAILFSCVVYKLIPSPDVPYLYLSVSERMDLVRSEILERANGRAERGKKRSDSQVQVSFFSDDELLEEEKRLERFAEAAKRASEREEPEGREKK